ncbi:MAG: DUF6339 family protein [Polyangiaceae bacterium]
MIRLYPRLPRQVARELAENLSSAGAVEVADLAATTHEAAIFGATGGNVVSEKDLNQIADDVRSLADTFGFPAKPAQKNVASFEARCAVYLHDEVAICATEAAREDVWSFFGCVLMPDIVRWRWGGKTTATDRFLGGDRGLRNTFGRLWWRAAMLRDDWWAEHEPYELLRILTEDQVVGFVERPRAVVSRLTAVATAREVLAVRRRRGTRMSELDLLRDVMKRFLRRGMMVTYEALAPDEVRAAVRVLVEESLQELSRK